MSGVVAFPGVDLKQAKTDTPPDILTAWFHTITSRVKNVTLDHAVVILLNAEGEQIVYSMNDIRKDQMVGMLHIAAEQALYGEVAT